MSYPPLPPVDASADDVRAVLADLAGRKEFRGVAPGPGGSPRRWDAYLSDTPTSIFLPGLRLSGAQLFIRGFENPDTPYSRVLIKWQPGTGKSIAAISIAHEFVRQFRARAALGERAPTVFVISFTARETIQEDMLRHPEFGFTSAAEVEELRRLRAAASGGGAAADVRALSTFVGALRRRITDRGRGGYYQFYGYKEFANRLFTVTRAGLKRGFDVGALYGRSEGEFAARLDEAVAHGDVLVDTDLLDELRGGLLIADEIHNVYNILEANNYGVAIQYALDVLGAAAPRAVFMSATPVTGSAAEIVDLLNLLVPRAALPNGAALRRADLFARAAAPADGDESWARPFIVSQLRGAAAELIARLAAGRVSFLLDADVSSYPRRVFEGEDVAGVPYLRLTLCPMAPFHERTLAAEQAGGDPAAGLPPAAGTLYDMAFPNPEFAPDAAADVSPAAASYGLYLSGETPSALSRAPEAWRAAAGVVVERAEGAPSQAITGAFLGLSRLALYSTKFARIAEETLAAVRAGPGKIMIYHHRVRMSGVLALQEVLRMNGFADETSAPTDATICAVCGVAQGDHERAGEKAPERIDEKAPEWVGEEENHTYAPARFVVAHSDVDRSEMLRSLARFNAPANLRGYLVRVVIGSRIVREGLNFRGVRRQLVASLPTDYPTLVQVFGRVVRKGSHADLPAAERDVRISVFVSTRRDGRPSPELRRYMEKGREYLVIQEVERALHAYAVDGFANFGRVCAALRAGTGGEMRAGLDAMPYSPVVDPATAAALPVRTSTFLAYGHGEREVASVAAACRALFRARPVWTYADLWAAVRGGAVRGFDGGAVDEGNFALALASLRRAAGEPPTLVVRAGRFYITAAARPDGSPALDVESYLRRAPPPPRVAVRVADFVRDARGDHNWGVRLREFERTYLARGAPSAIELALVEYGASFHYALLRRLTIAAAAGGVAVTSDDARVGALYRRFHIAVTGAEAAAARSGGAAGTAAADAIVGYVTPEAVSLYDGKRWYAAALTDFAIGRRHTENDIVVGFVVSLGPAAASTAGTSLAAEGSAARFKIRAPVQKLTIGPAGDNRNLARGAVCETRPREELEDHVRRLRAAVAATPGARRLVEGAKGGGEAVFERATPGFAAEHAAKASLPTAAELCGAIRVNLLALEEAARSRAGGMTSGLRWLYLFNDQPPTVSALTKRPTTQI